MAVSAKRLAELRARADSVMAARAATAATPAPAISPERLAELKAKAAAITAQRSALTSFPAVSAPASSTAVTLHPSVVTQGQPFSIPTTLTPQPAPASTVVLSRRPLARELLPATHMTGILTPPQKPQPVPNAYKPAVQMGKFPALGVASMLLERPAYGLSELGARLGKMAIDVTPVVGPANAAMKQKAQAWWRGAVDFLSHPEKNGVFTPEYERRRAAYLDDAQKAGTAVSATAGLLDATAQTGAFLVQMAAIGKADPRQAQTILQSLGRHSFRVGLLRFATGTGNLTERFKQAVATVAYTITPYIVATVPVAGIGAKAVDTALNMFLSSPTYYELVKSGGMTWETAGRALPTFMADFMFTLNTTGRPDVERRATIDRYLHRTGRFAGLPNIAERRAAMEQVITGKGVSEAQPKPAATEPSGQATATPGKPVTIKSGYESKFKALSDALGLLREAQAKGDSKKIAKAHGVLGNASAALRSLGYDIEAQDRIIKERYSQNVPQPKQQIPVTITKKSRKPREPVVSEKTTEQIPLKQAKVGSLTVGSSVEVGGKDGYTITGISLADAFGQNVTAMHTETGEIVKLRNVTSSGAWMRRGEGQAIPSPVDVKVGKSVTKPKTKITPVTVTALKTEPKGETKPPAARREVTQVTRPKGRPTKESVLERKAAEATSVGNADAAKAAQAELDAYRAAKAAKAQKKVAAPKKEVEPVKERTEIVPPAVKGAPVEMRADEVLSYLKDEHAVAAASPGAARELSILRRDFYELYANSKNPAEKEAYRRYLEWSRTEGKVVAKKAETAKPTAKVEPQVSVRERPKTVTEKPLVTTTRQPRKPKSTAEETWEIPKAGSITASDHIHVTAKIEGAKPQRMEMVGVDKNGVISLAAISTGEKSRRVRFGKNGWVDVSSGLPEPITIKVRKMVDVPEFKTVPEPKIRLTKIRLTAEDVAKELKDVGIKIDIPRDEDGLSKMTSSHNPLTFWAKRVEMRAKAHGLPPLKGNSNTVGGAIKMMADATGRVPRDIWNEIAHADASVGRRTPQAQIPLSIRLSIARVIAALETAEKMRPGIKEKYALVRSQAFSKYEAIIQQLEHLGRMGSATHEQAISSAMYHGGSLISDAERSFAAIEPFISQADKQVLYQMITDMPNWSISDKMNARRTFGEILQGKVPGDKALTDIRLVFGDAFTKTLVNKRSTLAKIWENTQSLANVPRLLQTIDFMSALMRQAGVEVISHPITLAKGTAKATRWGFTPGEFAEYFDYLTTGHKYARQIRQSELPITDPRGVMLEREEPFVSRLVQDLRIEVPNVFTGFKTKIDINPIGQLSRFAERTYVGLLTKARVDLFSNWLDVAQTTGEITNIYAPKGTKDADRMRDMAKSLAIFTGRGPMPQDLARAANLIGYAPRFQTARLQALNPWWYLSELKRNPALARRRMGDMAKYLAFMFALLYAGKASNVVEVELDPRSTDVLKGRVGNVRFDVLGGFQQYYRLAAQMVSGRTKSSDTGVIRKLSEPGFGKTSRLDVLSRFTTNKLAPAASLIADALRGKDFSNRPFTWPRGISERLLMLWVVDVYDAMRDEGTEGVLGVPITAGPLGIPIPHPLQYQPIPAKAWAKAIPVFGATQIGAGVQTYKQKNTGKAPFRFGGGFRP